MTRRPALIAAWTAIAFLASASLSPSFGQSAKAPEQKAPEKKPAEPLEPPEEDENESRPPKEYSFNPLQAESELKTGLFYFRKGSWKAAAGRFEEATRWHPAYAEAYLRWGEALTKLGEEKKAKTAWLKYLEIEPEGKQAAAIRKKIKP